MSANRNLSANRTPSSRTPILNQARDRLQRAIAQHRQATSQPHSPTNQRLSDAIAPEVARLGALLQKLDQGLVRIAVFGLVSRGKSALLNALVGEQILETGPINGVTLEPQTIPWPSFGSSRLGSSSLDSSDLGSSNLGSSNLGSPKLESPSLGPLQVELIDTPGLDEIGGQARADMAQTVAEQADLILFVLAGDLTRKELQAIRRLWRFQKPLLLVFNKTDLYPAPDRQTIVKNLQQYLAEDGTDRSNSVQLRNILQVAAAPAPLKVQTEWPDGRITQAWEAMPPQIEALSDRLHSLLAAEGTALVALNALVQSRELEQAIARKTIDLRQAEAEALIWKFARAKGIAIAANPIALLDVLGGAVTDLALIRALANLYGLPMTSYEAGALWRKIIFSSGGLFLAELGSGVFLGLGKGAAAVSSFENPAGLLAYGTTAIAQGSLGGYGAYIVGQAAQTYLEQGCTWGETGASTLIRGILAQVDRSSILYRLRTELSQVIPRL